MVEVGLKGRTLWLIWQETGAKTESYFLNTTTSVSPVINIKWIKLIIIIPYKLQFS